MSDLSPLAKSLQARFAHSSNGDKRHIAFWYDPKGEFVDHVDELAKTVGAEVIHPDGDEFAIKYRLLKLEPNQNFIVYRQTKQAENTDNWLLDLELAYGIFSADKASTTAEALGLKDADARAVVGEYEKFFNAKDRVEKLKKRLDENDDRKTVLAKMVATLLKTDKHSLSELTRKLLVENAEGETGGLGDIRDYGLEEYFWSGITDIYGYNGQSKTIEAFVHWLHKAADSDFEGFNPSIEIDFDRWRKDSVSSKAMVKLAERTEKDLQLTVDLNWSDIQVFLEKDAFKAYDKAIVLALAERIVEDSVTNAEVEHVIRMRQHTFWYSEYQNYYLAIQAASDLLGKLSDISYPISGFDDGISKYVTKWSHIDRSYRHFVQALRQVSDPEILDELSRKVENFYTNKYVEPLATAWQVQVDAVDSWTSETITSMRNFYKHYVAPLVESQKRVAVIISDALRFEVADELASRLRSIDKVDTKIEPILGVLPSYTQMGMAALLPHATLGFKGEKSLTVVDENQRTDGTAYRAKILEPYGGYAVQAEDLKGMTLAEMRDIMRPHKFVYIYHNEIDKRGDSIATERQVFQAVTETIDALMTLIERLKKADIKTVFVTADHGFLFQDRELDESGYLTESPQGDSIVDKDRRRVVGLGLKKTGAFRHFTPEQLNLSSNYEVLIPKGTKRLKLNGSGSRYVHGGSTLQEVVVPVVSVAQAKSSSNDVKSVEIVIQQKTNSITTNSFSVEIAQLDSVREKNQARDVRVAIWHDDVPLTRIQTLRFDFTSPDQRERIHKVALRLGPDATAFKGKNVELRVEELIPNTDSWRAVAKASYLLNLSFGADF